MSASENGTTSATDVRLDHLESDVELLKQLPSDVATLSTTVTSLNERIAHFDVRVQQLINSILAAALAFTIGSTSVVVALFVALK